MYDYDLRVFAFLAGY